MGFFFFSEVFKCNSSKRNIELKNDTLFLSMRNTIVKKTGKKKPRYRDELYQQINLGGPRKIVIDEYNTL